MDNIIIARLQFEFRFNHILNFSSLIKNVLNPFLKFSKGFNIQAEGSVSEVIKLHFEDYYIDCRADRFILVSEGIIENFNKETSAPIAMYFDILNKFKESTEHFKINNHILLIDFLSIKDQKLTDINKTFFEKYYKPVTNEILVEWNDIGILLETNEEDKETSIMMGPFSKKDIEKRGLFPIGNKYLDEVKDKYGYMLTYKNFKKEKTFNYKIFNDSFNFGIDKFNSLLTQLNG